jgi:hypothetical protein
LQQAEYSFPRTLTSHLEGKVTARAACNDAKLKESPLRFSGFESFCITPFAQQVFQEKL